jgi:uncharacterized protein
MMMRINRVQSNAKAIGPGPKRPHGLLLFGLLLASLLSSYACAGSRPAVDENAYAKEIDRWRAERAAELKSEQGWLTLVGLYWLKEGENKFGADRSNEIVLPAGKAPQTAGSLWLKDGIVRLESKPGVDIKAEGRAVSSLELRSDAGGQPTLLSLGSLTFQVIKRGDRLGLRVKDRENPARVNFKGVENFPTNSGWRKEARLERFNPPKTISIVNVLGMEEQEPSPGAVVFEVDGKTYRLDALTEKGEEKLFIIFADKTSGKETYGAGRYLYADPPDARGRMIIDFNKAYSPPCAFTAFATCPLPPAQNKLPFRVEAGEKYGGH